MANQFLKTLDLIRGNDYGGFFSSVFNVEGGEASIADERMPACDDCFGVESHSFDCDSCGRSKSNFIKFRAGDGDGIYAVVDICLPGDEPLGGLLIFERNLVGNMLAMVENGSPQLFDLDFSEVMEEMEGVCIGNITLIGDPEDGGHYCLYVGDAGADDSGKYALSYFHADPGEYSIFLFGVRQAALILPRNRLEEFGLSEEHDWSEEEIRHFAVGSMLDTVMSHMNPAGIDAVAYNVELNRLESIDEEDIVPNQGSTFISWMVQLHDMAPERVPAESKGFFNGDIPADDLLEVRLESAAARGYISPPPSDKPKKRSLFK
jgi:hypothetical protein